MCTARISCGRTLRAPASSWATTGDLRGGRAEAGRGARGLLHQALLVRERRDIGLHGALLVHPGRVLAPGALVGLVPRRVPSEPAIASSWWRAFSSTSRGRLWARMHRCPSWAFEWRDACSVRPGGRWRSGDSAGWRRPNGPCRKGCSWSCTRSGSSAPSARNSHAMTTLGPFAVCLLKATKTQ